MRAREADRFVLAAMAILAALCLLAGIFPGQVIDALGAATQVAVGARMPTQSSIAWLSIAPVAESRSSYNGLLVFLFIAMSAVAGRELHPSLRLRRACGALLRGIAASPIRRPATQYSARASRSRSGVCSAPSHSSCASASIMPAPGETRSGASDACPQRQDLGRVLRDRWSKASSAPRRALNRLQFLTIRQYLSVVFGALVTLLVVLASWP